MGGGGGGRGGVCVCGGGGRNGGGRVGRLGFVMLGRISSISCC